MPYVDGVPYVSNSDTSRDAAKLVDVRTWREKVFAYITRSGNATCDEVEIALKLRHTTASARIRDLVLSKRVVDSGTRRQVSSGRTAVVWTRA